MRMLLVEDDEVLGSAIGDLLSSQGNGVDWCRRIADADLAMDVASYELVLLDLNLPDGRGLDFLRRMRSRPDIGPVIIITAQDQISVRIEGLNSGADDYLVKPFDLTEMTARVAAVSRRYSGTLNPTIRIGAVEIDITRQLTSVDGVPVTLTSREWAVLKRLLSRPGAIVGKADLEDSLFAFGEEVESNAVEVYVSRVRKKLGKEFIHTIRGVGYQIVA